jgi:hypothetical protein
MYSERRIRRRSALALPPKRKGARQKKSSGSNKFAISFAPALALEVRRAARQGTHGNVSAWLAEAALQRLRLEALDQAIKAHEARHGVITDEEVAEVERQLWPSEG